MRCRLVPGLRAPLLALCLVATAVSLNGQRGAGGGDWRYTGGDAGGTKYSPLDQITRANVGSLRVAWRWKADNFGPRPEYNLQATPLAIGGRLYTTAGIGRAVVAIDGATGETLWTYRYDEGERGRLGPRQNHRGLAFWSDGRGDDRLLYITPGYHLIALNATTGQPVASFGTAGVVDLFDGLDRQRPKNGAIGSSSPPMIVKDVAVIGAALQSAAPSRENIAGHIRGYDVRTGKRRWIFHTIPVPGEVGNETWQKDSWAYTGNAGVWAPMSADQELGYVYLPVETPTNDLYGGHRPGHNLFADSLVCLDASTGRRVWHFQLVHHGIWDYDTVAPPILLDLTVNGRPIKAVAQVTKQAFTYVFDRVTGAPVWPIDERPVPQSDVPGEQTAPTQPFPTRPAPFDRQGVTKDDLIDFTPALRAEAERLVSQYKIGPLFTPPIVAGANGLKAALWLPNTTGGANWQGGAADPETGMMYVASHTLVRVAAVVHDPRVSSMDYVGGGGGDAPPGPRAPGQLTIGVLGPQGLPLIKPPYGRITAIDLNSGDHVWMKANGETPVWIRDHPALKGVTLPPTGRFEHSGLMVTRTLLFSGEGSGLYAVPPGTGGPMFRAHDKWTGEVVAEIRLPSNQSGIPMTYMAGGKQFIVVPAGAVGSPGEFIALALP